MTVTDDNVTGSNCHTTAIATQGFVGMVFFTYRTAVDGDISVFHKNTATVLVALVVVNLNGTANPYITIAFVVVSFILEALQHGEASAVALAIGLCRIIVDFTSFEENGIRSCAASIFIVV